mmetsp:Transcript_24824/g.44843  ORF Transcript_24824/g.44843 Transcript_24824/m.44843 type:complete len:428 (+) Transcript_24824:182-1465(+)
MSSSNNNHPHHPPLDPPPFKSPIIIRKCVKHTARIQYLDKHDDNDNAMEEVLILTSVPVLVDDMLIEPDVGRAYGDGDGGDGDGEDGMFCESSSDFSDFSDEDDSESESESDDEIMEEDEDGRQEDNGVRNNNVGNDNSAQCCTQVPNQGSSMKAYLKGKKPLIKNPKGTYGYISIYYAKVLQKSSDLLHWTETGEEVAVKQISWEMIRATRGGRMSEDFVKEIAALQYVAEWHSSRTEILGGGRGRMSLIKDTHVMSPDTIMSDESNLYIVMPYCREGDLFQRVASVEECRLSEDESRFWFKQILKGLESLQHMQICHKDLSPENFIILDNTSLVIDFGMCLRIPYSDAGVHFITPKVACGKKPYIAPEIIRQLPFDGHAVDIWAGIVLLFQHSFVICIHIFHCTETWCFHSRSHLLLCLSIYICP